MKLMPLDQLRRDDRSWTQEEWRAAYLALAEQLAEAQAENQRVRKLWTNALSRLSEVWQESKAFRAELCPETDFAPIPHVWRCSICGKEA